MQWRPASLPACQRGHDRDRTCDIQRVVLALYRLSYVTENTSGSNRNRTDVYRASTGRYYHLSYGTMSSALSASRLANRAEDRR